MHSHVMWARDLGAEHNKLLLNLVPDRTVWLVEADCRNPKLIPYEKAMAGEVQNTGPREPAVRREKDEPGDK